jgi:hypothetical protein
MGSSSSSHVNYTADLQGIYKQLYDLRKFIADTPFMDRELSKEMRKLQREHNLAIIDEVLKICNAINNELSGGKVLLSNPEHTKEDEMRILINTFAYAKQLEVILETHVHAKRQGVEWTHGDVYQGIIKTCTSVVKTWNVVKTAIVSMIDSGEADSNIKFFVGRLLDCMWNIQNMLRISSDQ